MWQISANRAEYELDSLTIDEPVFQTRAKPNGRMIDDLGWRGSATPARPLDRVVASLVAMTPRSVIARQVSLVYGGEPWDGLLVLASEPLPVCPPWVGRGK
jgi:hypothetical protein